MDGQQKCGMADGGIRNPDHKNNIKYHKTPSFNKSEHFAIGPLLFCNIYKSRCAVESWAETDEDSLKKNHKNILWDSGNFVNTLSFPSTFYLRIKP